MLTKPQIPLFSHKPCLTIFVMNKSMWPILHDGVLLPIYEKPTNHLDPIKSLKNHTPVIAVVIDIITDTFIEEMNLHNDR